MASPTLPFEYEFRFPDGRTQSFRIELDEATLANVSLPSGILPSWTRLESHQCPNCPLEPDRHPVCPPARALAEVVDGFRDLRSFESVEVRVRTRHRTYSKPTDVQTGVSALIGLLMTTAGCPILDRLRPMVDTHLPFQGEEESTYRILSSYLLAQYFRAKNGLEADWTLAGLVGLVEELGTVNRSFMARLRSIPMRDASANALVILDNLGALVGLSIARDKLARLARIYRATWAASDRERESEGAEEDGSDEVAGES